MSVDWDAIYEKLPTGKGQKAERKEMFNMFDPNGNGILSLAECDKAMRDVICIDELFDAKPAIMRAWQIAKNCTKSKRSDGHGDDYIEFREFKFFLCALRQYFEYFVAFSRVDADDDRRINLEEFTAAQELMEKWVGPIEDAEAEFGNIDLNEGGVVLFDEFCKWAITKALDLDDDDDAELGENTQEKMEKLGTD